MEQLKIELGMLQLEDLNECFSIYGREVELSNTLHSCIQHFFFILLPHVMNQLEFKETPESYLFAELQFYEF